MITPEQAKQIIANNTVRKTKIVLPLPQAQGYVLAQNITAPIHTPPFHQSAMDGYALRYSDYVPDTWLEVLGTVQAGTVIAATESKKGVYRIFTGAAVPANCDTVVIQEHVQRQGDNIKIMQSLASGDNVRLAGSQCVKGSNVLLAGAQLNAAAIGLLQGMGITEVEVFRTPQVSIIVTGKELHMAGTPLPNGKIYESNGAMLVAAMRMLGIGDVRIAFTDDNVEEIKRAIGRSYDADVLIVTGGVSVGDYDYVVPALQACGMHQHFHKVAQKPGKPFLFGAIGPQLVFGLPGNPGSVLTCFYIYVANALLEIMGKHPLTEVSATSINNYTKKPGLTHFVKAQYVNGECEILGDQASYLLTSFAQANLLVHLPSECEVLERGNTVVGTLIPL